MKKIITIIVCIFISIFMFGKNYTISEEGIAMIKDFEKCMLTAYPDAGGWSIGYGHHTKDIKEGMKITKKQADKYFEEDIKKFTTAVNRLIKNLPYEYEFSQGFIDGLFSLVYNCGETGVKKSIFYQRLLKCRVTNGIMNESDFNFTVAGVKNSRITCKGHIDRRYKEHLVMLS